MRMVAKTARMVGAGNLPPWVCTEQFRKVPLSGFREPQKGGETWTHPKTIDRYRKSAVGEGRVSLFTSTVACRGMSLFTGASLRTQFPSSEGFAIAILLLRKPWREAGDLRGEPVDKCSPEFNRFIEFGSCPLALQVSVVRARASTSASNAPWGDPSNADVVDPDDFDEADPRIYSRQAGGAADLDPDLGDFGDYGDIRDWTSGPLGAGYPGSEESATWRPKRAAEISTRRYLRRPSRRRGLPGEALRPIRRQC